MLQFRSLDGGQPVWHGGSERVPAKSAVRRTAAGDARERVGADAFARGRLRS